MFDVFAGLFDNSLLTLKFNPDGEGSISKIMAYATFNTILRGTVLAGFTYGAIRVVITAVSHGSF